MFKSQCGRLEEDSHALAELMDGVIHSEQVVSLKGNLQSLKTPGGQATISSYSYN